MREEGSFEIRERLKLSLVLDELDFFIPEK